ncbi:MAG TPA: DUF3108 domain-containing protein [Gemmatimonadales bacterium]|nr:DUF3108 domain-containing protein [Gemmatimonadales bacterium]
MLMLAPALLLQTALAANVVAPRTVPFGIGERLEYQGRWNFLKVGTAVLEVETVTPERGVPSWHFTFTSSVSVPLYKNTTVITSWTGVEDFISRRFTKAIDENGKSRRETFRIYPDSGFFRRNDNTETKPTPKTPLDDVAFFYWIRTVPLELGKTYRYENYFRAEKNPVIVKVEKRGEKEMPDGTKVKAVLLRPIVDEENGMFSKKSDAKLWLTDDARRLPLEIESTYNFGTVKLVLTKVTAGS